MAQPTAAQPAATRRTTTRAPTRTAERSLLVGVSLVAALAAQLAWVGSALACATCACGDPTLTTMGTQQPFAGRVRASLAVQHRTDAIGRDDVDRVELSEQRVTAALAYAPIERLMVSVAVPVVRRDVRAVSLAEDTFVNLGDVELRARGFVFRDRAFAPRHLVALIGGLRLPTAPVDADAVDPETQPGTGSFDPLFGASYGFFADPWSVHVSEVIYLPTESRAEWRVGASWRGTHALQYQFDDTWGARLGADTRLDAKTRSATGGDEPDSGGFVLFASPAVVVGPTTDLVLDLAVHLPVVNALVGTHDEGVMLSLGAAYDF